MLLEQRNLDADPETRHGRSWPMGFQEITDLARPCNVTTDEGTTKPLLVPARVSRG